jgi:hypothetical protein
MDRLDHLADHILNIRNANEPLVFTYYRSLPKFLPIADSTDKLPPRWTIYEKNFKLLLKYLNS